VTLIVRLRKEVMQTKTSALYLMSRLPCLLTAALAFGASAPSAAATATPGHQRAALSWATYQPQGWSAGSVSRGTGFRLPDASRRVREVQSRLDRLGYGVGKVDGLFGPKTDAAVRRLQQDRALQADGIVGPETLKDLRSRTRWVQWSSGRTTRSESATSRAERNQATARNVQPPPTTAKNKRLTVAPDRSKVNPTMWWRVMPFMVIVLVLTLLAAVIGLLPRSRRRHIGRVYVEGRSEDERIGDFRGFAYAMGPDGEPAEPQETPSLLVYDSSKPNPVPARLTEITAIDARTLENDRVTTLVSRRRPSRPGDRVIRRSARRNGNLHVAHSVEDAVIETGVSTLPRTPARMSDVRGDHSSTPLRWVGARVHLADAEGVIPTPDMFPVELELFAESEHGRWETGLLANDEPFLVSLHDLESSVRELVVPHWLSALVGELAKSGMVHRPEELARLQFAVERSIEVERAMAETEVLQMQAG
jgi:hypothetical protein